MLERLTDLPPGLDGVKATGKLTKADYETVMMPLIDDAVNVRRHLRFLYQVGPGFESLTAGAMWDDAKVGLRAMRLFDACAVVSDVGWIVEAVRLTAFMMPCPVKTFGIGERAAAIAWLQSVA